MHHAPNIFDFLADPQVERVAIDRCRFINRPDGSRMVAVDDNGVTIFGPVTYIDDPAQWPFEAGGELVQNDPAFKTIAELTISRTVAVEGVRRLVDDLTAARGMASEGDITGCVDLVDATIENGHDLLEELQKPERL